MAKNDFFTAIVKLVLGDTSSLEESLQEKVSHTDDDDDVTEVSYEDSLPHHKQEDVRFAQ